MNKRIFFHEMERSIGLENYANEHLEGIINFLKNEREPIYLDLTLDAGRPHAHNRVELRIKSPNYELICHEEGPEIYKVLDSVIDRMLYQLRQKKELLIDEARTKNTFKGS